MECHAWGALHPRALHRFSACLVAVAFLLHTIAIAAAQEYYQKEGIELEVNRTSGEDAYLTFTRRDGTLPAERLVIGLPTILQKDEASTGAGINPAVKVEFQPGQAEVAATGKFDNGEDATLLNGIYRVVSAEDLTKEQKARAEKLDVELNRVYGEVRAKLTPTRAAELKDLQREWIHSVYTPDIDAGSREPTDGEHWRQQADQAADRIKFLRDYATGRAASGPPSLQVQLKAAEDAEAWPSVAEIARHLLTHAPKDSALWEKRARAFASAEDWPRCAATLNDWSLAVGQKLPVMDSLRGDVALAEGKKQEAVDAWTACVRAAPKDAQTRDKLADLLQKQNNWPEAAKTLEQRIKIEATPEALASLAVTYAVLQNWKLAEANIHRANKMNATDDAVTSNLPRFERVGFNQAEIKKLESAMAASPKSVGPLLDHAIFFFDLGWPEIALKDSIEALALWPESRCALLQQTAALATLQRADEADNRVNRSDDDYKKPEILRAIAQLDAQIQSEGPTAPLLGRRAHHLNRAGQYALSDLDTNAALKLNPDCDAALAARGEALLETSKDWEALPAVNRATEINPRNTLAWYLRGVIESKHHNFPAAVDALTKVLELRPRDRDALLLREKTYRELGRTKEANADSELLKPSSKP